MVTPRRCPSLAGSRCHTLQSEVHDVTVQGHGKETSIPLRSIYFKGLLEYLTSYLGTYLVA